MPIASVLIIDDDEVDRYALKRLIKKADIANQVFECENGKVALEFLTDFTDNTKKYPGEFPPILIFLDINMPIMDGFEFLEEYSKLRDENKLFNPTVLTMFSSSTNQKDRERAFTYKFVKEYIVKFPASAEELKETVSNLTGT